LGLASGLEERELARGGGELAAEVSLVAGDAIGHDGGGKQALAAETRDFAADGF
jgi:hypothetical protein